MGKTIADIKVFSAKFFPRKIQPTKNRIHVTRTTSRSTVTNSALISRFRMMAILEAPPTTRLNGIIKTAVPKADIVVPKIVRKIFLIAVKISFFL